MDDMPNVIRLGDTRGWELIMSIVFDYRAWTFIFAKTLPGQRGKAAGQHDIEFIRIGFGPIQLCLFWYRWPHEYQSGVAPLREKDNRP